MGTPPFVQPQGGQNEMLQKLQMLLKMAGGAMGGAGGPQGGGSSSPVVSPGVIGGMPGMPSRPASPSLGVSPNQPGTQAPPRSGMYQSGFEFGSPTGKNAAVVTSAIQGVSEFLTQAKQKKEGKLKAQAEGYMNQIIEARQSGDNEALGILMQDPKVISTLEKGLNYLIPKVPSEGPTPPEAMGVKRALDKHAQKNQRLPPMNTPGGVSVPRMPQSAGNQQQMQNLTSGAALNALQKDPALAQNMGLGTSLSGDEQKQQERIQAGFAMAPAEEKKLFIQNQGMLEKMGNDNKQLLIELASKEKIAQAGLTSAEKQTRMANSPIYYRANIMRDIADANTKVRKMVADGQVNKANQFILSTQEKLITNLRTNAASLEKAGKGEMAKSFLEDADKAQKAYDSAKAAMDAPSMEKILQDVFASD